MALLTSPKSAPWDIYPKELAVYGYGTALWEPNPPYISGRLVYEQIEVGDVGLIRHGSFMLLFNVFLDRSHPRQRHVPHDFRPLQLVESISDAGMFLRQIAPCTGTLNSVPLMTEYVTCTSTSASVIPGGLPLQAGIELSFQFSKKSGATLVFQQPARKYEIEQIGLLEQYVRDQYKSWTSFARGSGYSIDLEDLRVVTGVVRTADWAMAISQGTNSALNATASLVMPGILNNSASHQRYWRSPNQTIVTNCGPILVADGLGGNQTIFVGAFVMKARRLLPTKIRAAAGPHDFDSDDRDADSSPEVLCDNGKDESPDIVQIPDHGKDINVLSPVLDYILDTCPGADIAMARDSDLLPYLDGRYDADQLIKRLRDFAPDVVLNDGILCPTIYSFLYKSCSASLSTSLRWVDCSLVIGSWGSTSRNGAAKSHSFLDTSHMSI
ncbi:hypothetical protein NEOLEDRAFT_1137654 [Neolentinus lepideus HHB14362 ss-1]|uniref:Uncharacterized protein n=1 Tax=Neolentinus lepideus HHB14362 ss-1 TaxID=1314782 RepID=A0A165QN55_9AGAM|nr:hypothetical protein NEOLEDRAFT_1137654 [Neolentinus lepideus HHB14362 ss-1]